MTDPRYPRVGVVAFRTCDCMQAPRCQLFGGFCCESGAELSVLVPARWKFPLRLKTQFACRSCWQRLCDNWDKPIKGLTRPKNGDDDWKPSLLEVIRHGEIALAFEDQRELREMQASQFYRPGDELRYTPAQMKQIATLRMLTRKYGLGGHSRSLS